MTLWHLLCRFSQALADWRPNISSLRTSVDSFGFRYLATLVSHRFRRKCRFINIVIIFAYVYDFLVTIWCIPIGILVTARSAVMSAHHAPIHSVSSQHFDPISNILQKFRITVKAHGEIAGSFLR